MTLLHPVRHEAPLHELWAALVALTTDPHQPHPRLMTDPDVFDVFGEDDAA
jgi:hypothetical protein